MKRNKLSFGPAILVTAAFIGPGTVMMASNAGSEYGFLLLWAVAFSVVATIVLQEMAARLGIVTGEGLSQALKKTVQNPVARMFVLGLVLLAILIGNAAYQTGNILGAASGVMALSVSANELDDDIKLPADDRSWFAPTSKRFQHLIVGLIGAFAIAVIWIGRFDVLQLLLTLLVACMSLLFIYAALKSGPVWSEVAHGFVPRVPQGSEWVVVGLIGTTVVPYNLFLHASAAAEKWSTEPSQNENLEISTAIHNSRVDTIVSVIIGGVVTCAILITASVAFHGIANGIPSRLSSVQDVAIQLEPALGANAKILFAIGLCAAGLTSAITAPIAAGFAAAGCFGWSGKLQDWRLKSTATAVVLAGVFFGIRLGASPKETIILAQVANGILLPVIAVFLLFMLNRTELMREYKNQRIANVLGVVVILIVTLIAVRQINSVRQKVQAIWKPEQAKLELVGTMPKMSGAPTPVSLVEMKFGQRSELEQIAN